LSSFLVKPILNQIYYCVYNCTACHHYTNVIKNGLINLIKIYNREGTSLILSVARDSLAS
jgi:hypothetical protein